jgi:hypothetical protein
MRRVWISSILIVFTIIVFGFVIYLEPRAGAKAAWCFALGYCLMKGFISLRAALAGVRQKAAN